MAEVFLIEPVLFRAKDQRRLALGPETRKSLERPVGAASRTGCGSHAASTSGQGFGEGGCYLGRADHVLRARSGTVRLLPRWRVRADHSQVAESEIGHHPGDGSDVHGITRANQDDADVVHG